MKVLFLCMDMHNGFHGSFMHVLEYGEFFRARGDEVSIGSVFIGDENKAVAEALGISVYSLPDIPDEEYDLVYSLHLLLYPALLTGGLRAKKAIHTCLSASLPIERVPPSQFWPQFDLITAISPEIVKKHETQFQVPSGIFTVIPNHLPLPFIKMANAKQEWSDELSSICVISNHFVPELAELKDAAPFKIDFYGNAYGGQKRATPELLLDYDAVISIGKTVQYGLGLGIPVFEYDKFGGCGYIRPDDLEKEEATNFSGRGTARKLDKHGLLRELQGGYAQACEDARVLRTRALERYAISSLIERQLELINAKKAPKPRLARDSYLFANAAYAAVDYIYGALHYNQES